MNVRSILGFYFGKRESIIEIASSKYSLLVGFIFVLTAGLAREYDGEDLWNEPWHLLIPIVASLAACLLLFAVICGISLLRRERDFSVAHAFFVFLSLFWMTAPLAWLYAVPYEQFLTAAGSVQANLWSLAIVAGWRVLLMIRSVSVLFNWTSNAAIWPILMFADATVLAILYFTPLPVFNIMGGIRLSESESMIQGVAFLVGFAGFISLPIWIIGTIVVLNSQAKQETEFSNLSRTRTVSSTAWMVAIFALLIWIPILPITQPLQQNRRQAEVLLRSDKIESAVRFMSSKQRSEFPIHWDPPPRIGYGEEAPKLIDIVVEIHKKRDASPWVIQLILDKLDYASKFRYWRSPLSIEQLSDDELQTFVEFLGSERRGPEIAHRFVDAQSVDIENNDDDAPVEISETRIAALRGLLQLGSQFEDDVVIEAEESGTK